MPTYEGFPFPVSGPDGGNPYDSKCDVFTESWLKFLDMSDQSAHSRFGPRVVERRRNWRKEREGGGNERKRQRGGKKMRSGDWTKTRESGFTWRKVGMWEKKTQDEPQKEGRKGDGEETEGERVGERRTNATEKGRGEREDGT